MHACDTAPATSFWLTDPLRLRPSFTANPHYLWAPGKPFPGGLPIARFYDNGRRIGFFPTLRLPTLCLPNFAERCPGPRTTNSSIGPHLYVPLPTFFTLTRTSPIGDAISFYCLIQGAPHARLSYLRTPQDVICEHTFLIGQIRV